ncbi:heterokaryon incompatibility protein-domain-containing protein [Nemania sp. FL0031]|nr:heterokaryon incompatibility protein-domain-containing protein [Nemania sp. FL0031]
MSSQISHSPLYRRLQGSLIRTLQLLPSAPEEPIRCILKEVDLTHQNKSLLYQALSYVWGDPAETTPILVNGHEFQATRNLNDALHQLRQAGNVFFEQDIWVDAICINQNDLNEKSKQVPRMADIYSMATRVVIWLGRNRAEEEDIFRRGFECRSKLHELYVRDIASTGTSFDDWSYEQTHPELDETEKETLDIWSLMSRRLWFTRIWTIQEFCLAGDSSIFYAGAHSITVGALKLWGNAGLASFSNSRNKTAMRTMFGRRMWFQNQPSLGRTSSAGAFDVVSALLELIVRTWCITTSVPHDRIYGLLALATQTPSVRQDLPEELQPNYLLPYESVCKTYTQFIISWTGDLRILHCSQNDLHGVPSWVPDFRYLGMIHTLDMPETPSMASLTSDGNQLTVQGSLIGQCIKYVPPWNPIIDNRTDKDLSLDARHYFHTVIASLVQQVAELRNQSFNSTLNEFVDLQVRRADDLAWFFKQENVDSRHLDISDTFVRTVKSAMAYGKVLLGDGIILDFVRQDASVEAGDVVCMLKGSNLPSILRPRGEVYELVGGCSSDFSRNYDSLIGGTREIMQFTLV